MRQYIFSLLTILLIFSCKSPEELHTETYKGNPILVGKGSISDLKKEPYAQWFEKNYQSYNPDSTILKKIKPAINQYDFLIYMGTWCPDSRAQVPAFLKILSKLNYNKEIPIYFLPRKYNKSPLSKAYKPERVPVIIVLNKGKEIGRIIEYPMQTLEKDLQKIILNKNYKHELKRE